MAHPDNLRNKRLRAMGLKSLMPPAPNVPHLWNMDFERVERMLLEQFEAAVRPVAGQNLRAGEAVMIKGRNAYVRIPAEPIRLDARIDIGDIHGGYDFLPHDEVQVQFPRVNAQDALDKYIIGVDWAGKPEVPE